MIAAYDASDRIELMESFEQRGDNKKDERTPARRVSGLKGALAAGVAFLGLAADTPPAKGVGLFDTTPSIEGHNSTPGHEASQFSADGFEHGSIEYEVPGYPSGYGAQQDQYDDGGKDYKSDNYPTIPNVPADPNIVARRPDEPEETPVENEENKET